MPLYRQDVYAGFPVPARTKAPSLRRAYRDPLVQLSLII